MSKKERYCRDTKSKSSKSAKALERFLVDMDLSSPKFDDDYELRTEEMRALLSPTIRVGFKRLSDAATIPTKAHVTDSGFDLYASEDVIVEPGDTVVVKTGIAVKLPPGYEAQVRPRSGVTAKTKLRVQLGTIDNGYAGEIGVIVDNIYRLHPVIREIENIYTGDLNKAVTYDFTTSFKTLTEEEKDIGEYRIENRYHDDCESFEALKESMMTHCGTYLIRKGDRISQLVIQPLPAVQAYEIEGDIEQTDRGAGGFGSTGV